MSDVTRILNAIEQGDPQAASQLLPLVYDELRRLASLKLAQEKAGQTLQATALVHEAYLRLVASSRKVGEPEQRWDSRGHFFAAAAEAMRRILVDKARRKQRLKRGGDRQRLDLDKIEADGPAGRSLRRRSGFAPARRSLARGPWRGGQFSRQAHARCCQCTNGYAGCGGRGLPKATSSGFARTWIADCRSTRVEFTETNLTCMLYFYLLDRADFLQSICPALSASWQQRSFIPCQVLCRDLAPRVKDFFPGSDLAQEEPLLCQVARGMAFDRRFWQHFVGEVLMYSAVEIPRLETAPDAFCCLLAPEHFRDGTTARERFAPIQQVHYGTRDLTFGGGYYRPDFAGWNDGDDVDRLCQYLKVQDPNQWTMSDLEMNCSLSDDVERAAELEYVRQWFEPLCELYHHARDAIQVVVCEVLA